MYIYTCILCTHTRIHRFRPFGASRPDSWAHIEHPMCSVCVCWRMHTHTPTHTPTRVKNSNTQDNTFIAPSFQNRRSPPRQAISALHRLVETPHPQPPTRMNTLRTHERMCTPCSDCVADMYGDVKNTCGMLKTPVECLHLHTLVPRTPV